MTEQQRREMAQMLHSLVARKKVHKKEAFRIMFEKHGASRRSLYRWCAKFSLTLPR